MKPEERLHNRLGFGVPLFDNKKIPLSYFFVEKWFPFTYLVVSLATVLALSGGALRNDTKTAAREITFPLTVMLLLITYQVLLKGVVVHFNRNRVLKKEQIDPRSTLALLFL